MLVLTLSDFCGKYVLNVKSALTGFLGALVPLSLKKACALNSIAQSRKSRHVKGIRGRRRPDAGRNRQTSSQLLFSIEVYGLSARAQKTGVEQPTLDIV